MDGLHDRFKFSIMPDKDVIETLTALKFRYYPFQTVPEYKM